MKQKLFFLAVTFLFMVFPIITFAATPYEINQNICNRFEDDVSRLAAIMEEVRRRQGILETRVAFGNVDTQIESADYQITFAAEAIAYQRAQKYSSAAQLKSSLQGLRSKILKAKGEVGKVLSE